MAFFLLQNYYSGEACPSDSRCNCGDGTGSEVSGALLLEDKNLDLIIIILISSHTGAGVSNIEVILQWGRGRGLQRGPN